MMASVIFEFDAAWAEKWTKTGVPFLSVPTVYLCRYFSSRYSSTSIYITTRYIWFAAVKLEVVLPAVTQPSSAETMVLNTMKHGLDGEL